jgi:hypothetical protein
MKFCKHYLLFALAGALLLLPVTSHYAISWEDIKKRARTFVSDDTLQKTMPGAVAAFGLAVGGLYYWWMSKKGINQDEISPYIESSYTQNGIKLIQFQVYCQFNPNGGGMASCGYHSLLRGMQVAQAKHNAVDDSTLQNTLNDFKAIQYYFSKKGMFWGNNGIWRQDIIQSRKKDMYTGDWIDKEEIQSLWNKNKNKFIVEDELWDLDVVEDVSLIGHPDVDVTTSLLLKKIKLILNTEKMYFAIFILGTMEQPKKEDEDLIMQYGHWYTLIMHQNQKGERQYYITDSGSWNKTNRLEDVNAWKLINLIEQ